MIIETIKERKITLISLIVLGSLISYLFTFPMFDKEGPLNFLFLILPITFVFFILFGFKDLISSLNKEKKKSTVIFLKYLFIQILTFILYIIIFEIFSNYSFNDNWGFQLIVGLPFFLLLGIYFFIGGLILISHLLKKD